MAISAEEFMRNEKENGRSSKLDPFKNDILLLKQNGYSQKQIQKFLSENGVSVGLTTIHHFIQTRLKNAVSDSVQNKTIAVPAPSEKQAATAVQSEAKPKTAVSAPTSKAKFDWQKPVDIAELI